jgi:hypothetical protein
MPVRNYAKGSVAAVYVPTIFCIMKRKPTGWWSILLLLSACEQRPATAPPAANATEQHVRLKPDLAPNYAGTYAVTDTAVCALSITITRQGPGYRFRSDEQQGPVTITREGADTYFTFVGLKGDEPAVDIEAAWADSALLIQNYGNSMNEYTRFASCGAKYLTLRRQQP